MTQAGSSMECPLAALGRDTPAVKTPQYRHPLSSSPLDPNVYKMGKRSPIYNTERSTENFEYQKSPYQQSFDQHPHRSSPFATGETTHHPMELYKNRSSYSYNMNKHMSSLYLDDMMPSNRSSSSSTPILDLIRNSSLETDGFNNSLQDPRPTNRYTSSQSETSESDRFFIDYHSGDSPLHGNKRNYHHFNRLKNRGTKLTAQQLRMGDNDQGYHTLMSSSVITTHINPSYGNWSRTETITCGLRLEALNTSVLLQIFQWLDQSDLCNLALTCKRFSLVAWSPYLWKTIHIKEQNVDRSLRMILRKLSSQNRVGICTEVDVISIENGMNLSDKGLNVITATCSNLKNFKSHNSHQITSTAVHHLLWNCPLLQHLDLTGANHVQSLLLTLGNDIKINLKLQYLDVTDCSAITDSAIELIVQACPQLTYLYLGRCVNISDAGIKFIPTYSSTLRELSVSDCINITDFGLYELAKLGPCLRYLSVAKCDRVSDAGLKIIARKCYKLRYLNTRGCEAVSDDSIIALARCCSRLRALDIGKCDVSDAGLRALAECCPNLKKIGLRNCDMITDRGVQFIAYYCRGLQQLNIQDCQISIEGYRAVKKYCKRCVIEHTNPGFC